MIQPTSLYKLYKSKRLALRMASGNSASPPWGTSLWFPLWIKNSIKSLRKSSYERKNNQFWNNQEKFKSFDRENISLLQNKNLLSNDCNHVSWKAMDWDIDPYLESSHEKNLMLLSCATLLQMVCVLEMGHLED